LTVVTGTEVIAGLGSEGNADKRKNSDDHRPHLSDIAFFDVFTLNRVLLSSIFAILWNTLCPENKA
jgi:hypothetical protein